MQDDKPGPRGEERPRYFGEMRSEGGWGRGAGCTLAQDVQFQARRQGMGGDVGFMLRRGCGEPGDSGPGAASVRNNFYAFILKPVLNNVIKLVDHLKFLLKQNSFIL